MIKNPTLSVAVFCISLALAGCGGDCIDNLTKD